jgi:tetratricopeptide (TPR) repeat protein
MKKRSKKQPKLKLFKDDLKAVYVSSYEITYEPIQDREYKRLPGDVKDAIERLHFDAQRKPLEAIPELHDWIKEYPRVPIFYNYLTVAYSAIGDYEEAEEVTKRSIQRNPDYLFARLNYAELCLARKEYEKVAETFDKKFDLRMLYPKRKRFHISEVVNFMGLVGIYFYEIGEREAAEKYNEILQEIGPEYPIARRLKPKLNPNIFDRLWKRITGWLGAKASDA